MNDPFHHCSIFPALDAKCTNGIDGFIVLPSFSYVNNNETRVYINKDAAPVVVCSIIMGILLLWHDVKNVRIL